MSASSPRRKKPIETTGMWLFGGLTVLLALGKVLGLWPWSWWQVVLPLIIFLGFHGRSIAVGLLYLSVVFVPERPEAEETALVRGRTDLAHSWAGLVFVAGFGLNMVRRLAPTTASTGWWVLSGQVEVLLACGAFAVVSLWRYWSRMGSLLHQPEDSQCD